jgi:hypothetical protein
MQPAERLRHYLAMRSKDIDARPMVLRELSLLRALGTSLRTTSSHRSAESYRAALPFSRPSRPDAFALLPRNGVAADLMPLPAVKTPLDQVSKLK